MRSRNAWLYSLGLSGVLAFGLTGCGGGDVPDPGADEATATEEEGAPAAEPSPAPEAPRAAAAAEPPAAAEPVAAAPTAPPADAPKSDAAPAAKSDTAEMLALATAGPAAPSAPAGSNPASGPDGSAPAPAGAPGAPGIIPGREGIDPSMAAGPGGPGSPQPGAPGLGEIGPGDAGLGPAGGEPGAMGDPTGGGGSPNDPGNTNTPHGAVKAFLYALKHKDRDRLAEATALRANSDEGGKYRELFSRIIDSSISDSDLDDLASKLDGFQDSGMSNQVKSTGREGVTIRKPLKDGGWLQRTVTVRREKKGWGVLDITGSTEFEKIQVPTRGGRRR